MSKLLIVESPSKAKTLKKYLDKDFEVLASYGHVRDLVPKTGAVDTEHDFAMKYEIIERNAKHVDAIAKAAKAADAIYLATDPDREGEAISWHIGEILKSKKLLKDKILKRVVFHEITKGAVLHAIQEPRDISMPMVNAQQARRALDYLVGFNLSPLLWKKIRRGLSAGRVQSPALRLIVERELEIEAFQRREYWTVHLQSRKQKQAFDARLVQLEGNKVEQFSITQQEQQAEVVGKLLAASAGKTTVSRVEKKQKNRSPAAPFTTSTLQQEAVRKLGFTTSRAMRIAQQLYEGINIGAGGPVGLITYMRTDSFSLAAEAVMQIRDYIKGNFDAAYLPKSPIMYKTKAKNAQEAHEAIRPTDIRHTPDSLRSHLTPEQFRLYDMIWKRALACQMAPAKFDAISVDLAVGGEKNLFRATGQTMVFPGFIAVYMEGVDDSEEEGESKLPLLEVGEVLDVLKIWGDQHFTEPPPRYSEASLVKTLEEYGIGRPSTYASIISTLQDREYVVLDNKRFTPTDVARVVNKFLTEHFTKYVDYDFTANLENELDEIAEGERDWIPVLDDFWQGFNQQIKDKASIERSEISHEDIGEACPKCGSPLISRLGRYGKFVSCSTHPVCKYARNLNGDAAPAEPVTVGLDPDSGKNILLLNGPYGPYLQLGEAEEGVKKKPKRVSIPKDIPASELNLEIALKLISLPREIGLHPDTQKKVIAGIGPFGPYLNHDGTFKSIPKSDSIFDIDLPRAMELLAQAKAKAAPLRELGEHPKEGGSIAIYSGRYGPYVQHGKINATLPKDMEIETLTLDQALELLAAKAAKGAPPKKKPAKRKATAGKK